MLKVGQKLWCVPSSNRRGTAMEVTVRKVGNKFFYLDEFRGDYRFYIDGMMHDGREYMTHWQCYLSKELYEAKAELAREWQSFRADIAQTHNNTYTSLDGIKQARELLFGK